jgi:hypothetical protein
MIYVSGFSKKSPILLVEIFKRKQFFFFCILLTRSRQKSHQNETERLRMERKEVGQV